MRAVVVEQTGLLSSVQDGGRTGLRHLGIGRAGALDGLSLQLANRLVGNAPQAPAIECLLGGLSLRFACAGWLALAGADCQARLDGRPVWPGWRVRFTAGQQLVLGRPRLGLCSYVALDGGLSVTPILGSCAVDLSAGLGAALVPGAELTLGVAQPLAEPLGILLPTPPSCLRFIPGPEWSWFPQVRQQLSHQAWQISAQSNRMGLRLTGEPLVREAGEELRSHGLLPGVIQVPPDGQPIILGCEAQTCGGYPRLGMVSRADLWRLGQLAPGQTVRLLPVTRSQAQQAWLRQQRYLARIELLLAKDTDKTC